MNASNLITQFPGLFIILTCVFLFLMAMLYIIASRLYRSINVEHQIKLLLMGEGKEQIYSNIRGPGSWKVQYPHYLPAIIELRSHGDESDCIIRMKNTITAHLNRRRQGRGNMNSAVTTLEGRLCIVVNYEEERLLSPFFDDLTRFLTEQVAANANQILLGVGNECSSLRELNREYGHARRCLDYARVFAPLSCIYYKNLHSYEIDPIRYSMEDEKKLMNHVVLGNMDQVRTIVMKVYEYNIGRSVRYFQIRNMYTYFIVTFRKIVAMSVTKTLTSTITKELISLSEPPTSSLFIEKILDAFAQLTLCFYNTRESKNEKLRSAIFTYIHNNFHKAISLHSLSDELDCNYKYLSRYFKDQTGITFLKYLNSVRIAAARKLLEGAQGLTINDIAGKVGFLSANTFITVFKKFEGLTPGSYHSQIRRMKMPEELL